MERRNLLISLGSSILGCIGGIGTYEWIRRDSRKTPKTTPESNDKESDENEESLESIEEKENNLEDEEDAASYGALGYFSEDTIDKLQSGGYILYYRHEETQGGTDQQGSSGSNVSDTTNLSEWSFEDCSLQRNLNLNGWRRASNTGEAIDMLDIPFSQVLASPWCRCRKTAELVLDDYKTEERLNYENEDNLEDIRKIFKQPKEGQNIAMFAHSLSSMESGVLLEEYENSDFNEGHALVLDPSKNLESSVIDGPGINNSN
jgi:phosphohistidine phosphatase SixA